MNPNEKKVYHGKYITVSEEMIRDDLYERIHLRAGVHVIAVKEKSILLIREYRVHEGKERWKLVSGWIDKEHKTTQEIAQEELAEEAGLEAETWKEWKTYNTHGMTIGFITTYFVARGISIMPNPPINPDHDEVRELRWVSENEFHMMLDEELTAWDHDAMHVLQLFKEL